MCGIWACFHNNRNVPDISGLHTLKNRGPDQIITTILPNILLGFTHLKINGWSNQPLSFGKWWILCNGEIFNHAEIEKNLGITPPPNSSDCWILPYMFDYYGFKKTCQILDGEFAIIAYNIEANMLYTYRDPYGIRPLFLGISSNMMVYVSSEIKGLHMCETVQWIIPGTCTSIDENSRISCIPYKSIQILKNPTNTEKEYQALIKFQLTRSILKRCMSDKPIGALLSGGLDSSIVCAVLARNFPEKELNTFSIGIEGSPDLKYARIVSKHIGSNHHEILCTSSDFKNAVEQVIYNIESYDVTTVRASVGNWLVGKYISAHTDIKVVFNGDGSDELFGGYLYFHRAPSCEEFENEITKLLSEIHMYDVLRSDRCMASNGLEARTPFLDPDFVNLVRSIPSYLLRPGQGRMEKQILRNTFKDLLPEEIITRKKEAFSDGVNAMGTAWFNRENEAEYYKSVYDLFFPNRNILPHMWMPAWCPETTDPSARTLSNYESL